VPIDTSGPAKLPITARKGMESASVRSQCAGCERMYFA
jgi:hypothetical protein